MSNKNLAAANQETPRRGSIGSLLRSTREIRNNSLTEASNSTRISVRILTALEADDFATLPAEVFTRGFIKIYADYLGLDPSEILKLFTDQENLDPERPADRPYRRDILFGTTTAHPFHLLKGNPRLRIIILLVAALLSFYTLGAIIKSLQKHPAQDSPENQVAKSLVNEQILPLPAPGGELPQPNGAATSGIAGTPAPATLQSGLPTTPGQEAALPQVQTVGSQVKVATPSPATPTSPKASGAEMSNLRPLPGDSVAPVAPLANSPTSPEADRNQSAPGTVISR